jgi:DNA (cytosine-5)-methyltransferase 1
MYTHLDLFSGIGGFALGLQRTGKFKTIAFCEFDEFCHRVLRKNFGNVPIIKDIKSFDTERFIHEHGRPFIITGGFPCQPFSQAGLRQGTEDEKGRDLWSEMYRVISSLKPQWIIGENVSGFATLPLVFERTATDLETSGYQTVCFNIPACATNLKHERQRLWIVAHSESSRHRGGLSEERGTEGRVVLQGEQGRGAMGSEAEGCRELSGDVPYSGNQGLQRHELLRENKAEDRTGGERSHGATSQLHNDEGRREVRGIFEPRLGGKLSDGLSDRMDESEFGVPRVTTEKQDRAARLKAIGNAVIPTIPEIIARAIIEAEGD